jgi:hypothetical protein
MAIAPSQPPVFDEQHYAATWPRKLWRALQLGPRYYLLDLPRYFAYRRSRKLPLWDSGVFINPLHEFRPRCHVSWEMPSGYTEALQHFAREGVQFTMPPVRLEALVRAWWRSRLVSGDVIECGAYRGATSLLLALLGRLHAVAQQVLILDTFTGTPAVHRYDLYRRPGEYRPPAAQVEIIHRQAEALGVRERIEVHSGLFQDTFPKLGGQERRFAFVHIDANIYQGTLEACACTLRRVAPGGMMVFDDYNGVCDLGARLAIDECLAGHGLRPQPLGACSAYCQLT